MKLMTKKEQTEMLADVNKGNITDVSLHFDNGFILKMNLKTVLGFIKDLKNKHRKQ